MLQRRPDNSGPVRFSPTGRGFFHITCTAVIARLDRANQYSRAFMPESEALRPLIFHHQRSGILGRPLEPVIGRRIAPTRWRAMTTEYASAFSRRDAPEVCK
jgi:hypothetical protein